MSIPLKIQLNPRTCPSQIAPEIASRDLGAPKAIALEEGVLPSS
jgi:hypothetical protein